MLTPLRIGTDCSGIEAPIQALKQLGIDYEHIFAYINCVASIKANYNPKIIYPDINNRNNEKVENIDLYVCGFPCQPFSFAGKGNGFSDDRGNVFFKCIDLIRKKKPKYFILENVKGLCKKDTWTVIDRELKTLDSYNVYWKVLNTRNFGIPQNRERVYIVGSLGDTFSWPEETEMEALENYIDKEDTSKFETKRMRLKVPKDSIYVDLNFQRGKTYPNFPNSGLWNVRMGRYANCNEYLMLQGFPTTFKRVVSVSQFKKQIGNSMSVNILKGIIKNLIKNN